MRKVKKLHSSFAGVYGLESIHVGKVRHCNQVAVWYTENEEDCGYKTVHMTIKEARNMAEFLLKVARKAEDG